MSAEPANFVGHPGTGENRANQALSRNGVPLAVGQAKKHERELPLVAIGAGTFPADQHVQHFA
jgi:hypothetical protein